MKRLGTIALIALTSLRLTRFIVSDTLGEWLIKRPAEKWAEKHDMAYLNAGPSDEVLAQKVESGEPLTPQSKLVSGLSCPFCVGFWITLAVVIARPLIERSRIVRTLASALSINYVTAHISSRID